MQVKRIVLLCSIIVVTLTPVAAGYRLFMPEDEEVQSLVQLYTQAGEVFPDASFPLGKADLDKYAARLLNAGAKEKSLPPPLRRKVREYRAALDYSPGRRFIGSTMMLELAGFVHGDAWPEKESAQQAGDAVEGSDVYGGPDTAGANDFTRYPNDFHTRFVDFPDLLRLALAAGKEGHSGLHISAFVKREYHRDKVPPSNLFWSTERDSIKAEYSMIRTGYAAWRGEHFEARLGRTPVHYGDARFSTFLPSKELPWLDAFTYRYRLGPMTMTSYFGTLENRVSKDEAQLFGIGSGGATNGGYTFGTGIEAVGFDDAGELITSSNSGFTPKHMAFSETVLLSSMHRFVFDWPQFRIGVTGHSIVARERNALHIGDIFPVFSWHQGFVGHHNLNVVFDAAYSPLPRWTMYGQAAWDDLNAEDLIGIPDSALPNIGAFLGGIAWSGNSPFGAENRETGLHMKLELGRTHYLWGSYYSYDTNKGGYFERAIYRYKALEGVMWMPLTSPYGPGVMWADGELHVCIPKKVKLSLGGKYLSINSAADLLALPYERNDELEEAPRIGSYSLWAQAEWSHFLNNEASSDHSTELRLKARPVLYSYDAHLWPEFELSIAVKFSRFSAW